jgi:hypothetical protein
MTDAYKLPLQAPGYVAEKPYKRRPGSCAHRDNGIDPVPGCGACEARVAAAESLRRRLNALDGRSPFTDLTSRHDDSASSWATG